MKNQIYPCLWFDGLGKEASEFYCNLFKDSKITADFGPVVTFELSGEKFMTLDGGPKFKINPSISFFILCESVEEIDLHWEKLSDDGKVFMPLDKYDWSERYGWIQDKYGVSWQLMLGKYEDVGQKFTPSMLFSGDQLGKADEAIHFYTSVFKDSSITGIMKYSEGEDQKEGLVKHAQFSLNGKVFMMMESEGHEFSMNEAVSIVVSCKDQKEIDYYWDKLTDGGEESMCGWLKDKYGVSWQIVPDNIAELLSDPEKAGRVMQEVLKMRKLDMETMLNA
ncbi:MAG TPA: VOC family protein [Ignavibacteria bacterium]|nr:VOC family protein [Ignavibacteria bacterium]